MADLDAIVESLGELGYSSDKVTELNGEVLGNILNNDLVEFSKIIASLSLQLNQLLNLEEIVNPIESIKEESSFNLEISSFLKELPCPYRSLTGGPIDDRFKNIDNKLNLLDFMTSELQTAQIISANSPQRIIKADSKIEKSNDSEESSALKSILMSLGFPKPPSNVTIKEIWSKIESQLIKVLSELPKDYLVQPLLTENLTDKQWEQLMQINQTLANDFQMRRELLLTRLDVTIQSFKWSDIMKKNNNEIANLYQKFRKELSVRPGTKIYQILSARDDLLKQERTCSTKIMTKSHLHKIIIPKPPDRGGRTYELEAPPPEMPSFMKRKSTANPQNQRRGGHRGGGHRNDKWSNDGMTHQPKPQSDFERFNSVDYGNNQNYRGGGGGGGYRGRGGRGGRGGDKR